MSTTDLIRLIRNLISIGTVTEVHPFQALAKVNILDRETDFFPVLSIANSYKRKFTPLNIGEQALVLCPQGNADFGVILPSLFHKASKEPDGSNENKEITTYSDGTVISYDTQAKELKVDASEKITIICKSANVTADTVSITANTTNNGDVTINGSLTVSGTIADSKGDLTSHTHGGITTPR